MNEPCRPELIRSWHNHFDNYMPGYCGGISLGDCRDLDRLIREGVDFAEQAAVEIQVGNIVDFGDVHSVRGVVASIVATATKSLAIFTRK